MKKYSGTFLDGGMGRYHNNQILAAAIHIINLIHYCNPGILKGFLMKFLHG